MYLFFFYFNIKYVTQGTWLHLKVTQEHRLLGFNGFISGPLLINVVKNISFVMQCRNLFVLVQEVDWIYVQSCKWW